MSTTTCRPTGPSTTCFEPFSGKPLTRSNVLLTALVVTLPALAGCRGIALSFAADAAAASGTSYASDEDPELVREAVPFGLKTMEGLLEEKPRHVPLLTSLASSFTQYAYAFVQSDADEADLRGKLEEVRVGRERARKLYLRARDYGLRGLDARRDGLGKALREGRDVEGALRRAEKADVPLLYWTSSAWALAISNGKGDMGLVAELPVPAAAMERALALDEGWGEGALHEFFITFDTARTVAQGGGETRAKAHYDRALALSMNKKLGPHVAWAEGVLVGRQDREAFTHLLERVVRADPGEVPRYRLANILAQRRAKALLAHADDLFL
jgi:predicted anti-sigma-YlaC factor YlaD